jgi:excisionase family DNA binding protein
MQVITFEQIPSFLAFLGEKINTIEERVSISALNTTEIERPTDVEGAADHVSLDYQTIYRLVREKKIPFYKQGRKLYFYRSELNEWIRSGKPGLSEELQAKAESRFLQANKNRRG